MSILLMPLPLLVRVYTRQLNYMAFLQHELKQAATEGPQKGAVNKGSVN
jgi:hypothetical protein